MKELLTLENVQSAFEARVAAESIHRVPELLALLSDFYSSTAILGVDETAPDYDALLFEYGKYNFGQGPHFIVSLTRQFQIAGDEEFYQLRCTLTFADDFAPDLTYTSWSFDYPQLEDWRAAIAAAPGYIKASALPPNALNVILDQT